MSRPQSRARRQAAFMEEAKRRIPSQKIAVLFDPYHQCMGMLKKCLDAILRNERCKLTHGFVIDAEV